MLDADFAFTTAHFVGMSAGLFSSLGLRHFGDVPLNETTSTWAYQQKAYKVEVDLFNLLGSTSNDIAYFYGYRLNNEAAGPNGDGSTGGIINHQVEPRMVRVTASVRF